MYNQDVVSIFPVSQQIKISHFDVPHSVKVGENVKLKCDIEGKENPGFVLKWWFTPFKNEEVPNQIYQRITGMDSKVLPKFEDSISELTILVYILRLKVLY